MPKHWIAGSGEYGCLYDNVAVLPTKDAAIDYLCDIFYVKAGRGEVQENATNMRANLQKYNYADLTHGAQYCEITPCTCADPANHEG